VQRRYRADIPEFWRKQEEGRKQALAA